MWNFGSQLQIDDAQNSPPPTRLSFWRAFVTPIFAPRKIGCFETTFLVEAISVIPVPAGSLRAICWYLMGFMLNNIEASRNLASQPDQVVCFIMCISNILESKLHLYPRINCIFYWKKTPRKNPTLLLCIHPPNATPCIIPILPHLRKMVKSQGAFLGLKVSFGGWEHQQILYLPVFPCHEKEDFGRYLPKNSKVQSSDF